MANPTPQEIIQREKGRAVVRARYLGELADVHARRMAALHEVNQQLDRVARLLTDAKLAGLTLVEISNASGISRPTLYQLQARYSDSPGDLRLGVLQTIANLGWVTASIVATEIERDRDDVEGMIKQLLADELLEEDFNDDPVEPAMAYRLTPTGFGALEGWTFALEEGDPE